MPDLRRAIAKLIPVALLALVLGATPASAQDAGPSGGVSPTERDAPAASVPVAEDGPLLPAPMDLGGRIGAVLGMEVRFSGTLPGAAGRAVQVQRHDPRKGWVPIATAVADAAGAFTATWTIDKVGLFATRAIPAPASASAAQAASIETRLASVTGYRAAKATFFGPGLFGRRTACGQRLTRRLKGIAHRTLRCGSVVELVYRGRVVRAPVVDRGPFTRGVRYDLTQATARELGFRHTDTIGAAQVGDPPARRRSG